MSFHLENIIKYRIHNTELLLIIENEIIVHKEHDLRAES